MNYQPSEKSQLSLWDSWVYITDNDVIHLFFLAGKAGCGWGYAGHAVSHDWVHWEELPPVKLSGEKGAWDEGPVGTGMVFRHDDGRYYMTYTGKLEGTQQCHGLFVSDDLMEWQKISVDGPVWPRSQQPPYEQDENRATLQAWRDAFVTRNPEGQWEAFCAGRVDFGPHAGRGCIARCRLESIDTWIDLPPVADVGLYAAMEVPEVFEFAGRCWAIFSTTSGWGTRVGTPERPIAAGTFFLSADHWQGPYRAIPDNLLIGAGFNKMSAYVARVVEYQGQHLVYHHYAGNGGPPAFGLPKVLNADGDKLYLTAWEGIDALRRGQLDLTGWQALSNGPQAPGEWNVGGQVINGNCEVGAAILRAETEAVDVDIEVELTIRSGARAGLVTGLPATPNAKGIACLLDAQAGEITIGEAYTWINASGPNLSQIIDSVRRPVEHNRTYTVRLIHRHRYVELFIGDRLVFSTVTESVPQGGGIGCAVEDAAAAFNIRQAYRLEPMKVE
jgi:beta-fructofuranosidase